MFTRWRVRAAVLLRLSVLLRYLVGSFSSPYIPMLCLHIVESVTIPVHSIKVRIGTHSKTLTYLDIFKSYFFCTAVNFLHNTLIVCRIVLILSRYCVYFLLYLILIALSFDFWHDFFIWKSWIFIYINSVFFPVTERIVLIK